jgi:hypothetical protein
MSLEAVVCRRCFHPAGMVASHPWPKATSSALSPTEEKATVLARAEMDKLDNPE